MQAARRSLDIATIQYQEGLVDFERVLDSQRSLFSQQERLVATRGSVAQSLVALFKATGGGSVASYGPGEQSPSPTTIAGRCVTSSAPRPATATDGSTPKVVSTRFRQSTMETAKPG